MGKEVITVSSSDDFASSLRYIAGCIPDAIFGQKEKRNFVKIPVNVKNVGRLVDCIADITIADYKSHFIQSKIKITIEDEVSRHAFIRALCSFDRTTDKVIAKRLIKLTPYFLLDSFFEFMTGELKKRWQEVIDLANDNAPHLMCEGTFGELLRFLISNLESRTDEVHIQDCKIMNAPANICVRDDLPTDVRLVSQLISIAPKKIFLHDKDSSKITDFIQNVFGGRVIDISQQSMIK